MTDVLTRHKVLILLISLVIISLFVLVAYLMPKSSKIPSKGVFVLEATCSKQEAIYVNTIRDSGTLKI